MQIPLCICCAVVLATIGCSKKESASASSTVASSVPKAGPETINPMIQEDLSATMKAVQTANYDEVLAKLAMLKRVPKNDAEQMEYRRQSLEVEEALRQKAQVDPKAAAAYQMLGRVRMGR